MRKATTCTTRKASKREIARITKRGRARGNQPLNPYVREGYVPDGAPVR